MNSTAKAPGLYFSAAPRTAEPSPLRTDVAGFIGRARRGPVGRPVRVEGWRDYLRSFGRLQADATATYAVRGYFENEGQVAWIVRLGGYAGNRDQQDSTAKTVWEIRELDRSGNRWTEVPPSTFMFLNYRIEATSPGAWANGTRVGISYRSDGPLSKAEIDLVVQAPGEPIEYLNGILVDSLNTPAAAVPEFSQRSRLINLIPMEPIEAAAIASPAAPNPRRLRWTLMLSGGRDVDRSQPETRRLLKQEYLQAAATLGDENEVALLAAPGLYDDISDKDDQREILAAMIEQAEQLRDRLVLIDVPTDDRDKDVAKKQIEDMLEWVSLLRHEDSAGAAAVYHPRLSVPDPLGGIRRPLRNVPPSGHVAGVISRLDRQRGAHHTPANAPIFEAVDVTQRFDAAEQERCNLFGVNLLRCFAGDGLKVWGGRTMSGDLGHSFIAHRRLIHRLVRAIRRVAEPLVFDVNGPELRLALVRSITTTLLEAWRAGSLKGARPEEAFRVVCDETLNPPAEADLGRVHCEIEVAPATPMEFILLRISLSADGRLEVFES